MLRGTRYPHVETILREYHAKKAGKVLEIGAGGAVYKNIFQDYVGTDLPTSPYPEKGDLDVYCDAQYLPFKEDTFEMAFIVAALFQMQNLVMVLSEIKRVLKPGGHFIVFDYNKKRTKRLKATENLGDNFDHVWSPRELRQIIQKAGFHAQIINHWKYESSKGIKAVLRKLSYVPGFYFISTNLIEGWNVVVATKK